MTTRTSWRLLLRSFVVAELFKLRRSRVAKAMVVATAVASPILTGVTWLLLGDEGMTTFPRVLELIYLPLCLLAGLIGLLLAVEVMGSEFDQGTVRTVMGRGVPRWLFVGGKAAALLIAVAVNAVAGTLSGGVFAAISHLSQVGATGLAEGLGKLVLSCLPVVGIVALSGLAYAGILLLLVVLVRSSAVAMLGGLLIFGGDFTIASTIPLGTEKLNLSGCSIFRSTFVLLSQIVKNMSDLGIASEGPDDPWRAFLTLALYAVAGVVLACYVFRQQDLAGKR